MYIYMHRHIHMPICNYIYRQEYESGLPGLPPGYLPNPGKEPMFLMSPASADKFFISSATWEVHVYMCKMHIHYKIQ